tara:strand:+ start:6581 stop:6772 length:192 start_codon:yes stop_codon:yes gene_type:complete
MAEPQTNYYLKNREKRLAYQKKYNKENKWKIKHYQNHYWKKREYGIDIPPFQKEEFPIILYFD